MKKFFLAALLAAGTFNAFGAACATGSIQAQINAGSCTINGWTLDTWGLSPAATANGYNAVPIADNILVSFQSLMNGSTPGFSVTFSNNGLANNGFFTAVPGTPNQSANFNTNFSIVGAPIAVVDLSVQGASVISPSGSGQIAVQKIVYNPLAPPPASPSLGDSNVLTINGFQSSNPINVYNNQNNALGRVSVADVYQITAGNNGAGATLTSYTNTFYGQTPQTGVPEPMSFVLMGAGLVGIAALRRRNG
jgi:hypothetical protein